jgi:hypothetical protein
MQDLNENLKTLIENSFSMPVEMKAMWISELPNLSEEVRREFMRILAKEKSGVEEIDKNHAENLQKFKNTYFNEITQLEKQFEKSDLQASGAKEKAEAENKAKNLLSELDEL